MKTKKKIDLTWAVDENRQHGGRYRKKYLGKVFHSNQENTKSGKALAIEEFIQWKQKIDQEVSKQGKPHQEDYTTAISVRQDMLQWLALNKDDDPIRSTLLKEIAVLETEFKKAKPRPVVATGVLFDPIHRSVMPMADVIKWIERLDSLKMFLTITKSEQDEKTLQQQIDDYLSMHSKRTQSRQIEISTFKALQERTTHFQNWLRSNNRLKIDRLVIQDYHDYITDKIITGAYAQQQGANMWKQAKSLIQYLWRNDLCELPRNMNDPLLTIKVDAKKIKAFSDNELRVIWDNASERTRLYALLMLNCGMLPTDIADLKPSEYSGTHITRKRKKTGKQYADKKSSIPTVSWLLWDETKKLLDKFKSDGQWLLANASGGRLYTAKLRPDGKTGINSNIKSAWFVFCKKMLKKGVTVKPLENLRKTGASKLETGPYARYSQHMLGHAPSSVADQRYVQPSQDQFDEAMKWLGKQFNL